MDRIAKALAEHDEVYAEINDVLFGGGADELIEKFGAPSGDKKPSKAGYQAALAGNALATVGGAHALAMSGKHLANLKAVPKKGPGHKGAGRVATKVSAQLAKHPKALRAAPVAAGVGWVGLHGAELASDAYANHAIRSNYKRQTQSHKVSKGLVAVAKNGPDKADLHVPGGGGKYRLVARAADKATPKLKTGLKKAKAEITKVDTLDVVWEGEFSKVDSDKRQVFGYASVVEVNGEPVVDRQGDYISIDEVEKSAYDYVQKSRKGGNMHRRNGDQAHHVSDMIESFVITDEKIEKMGLPKDTPRGWWVGFQVHDDETWQEVKKGHLKGFSVHGKGQRVSKVMA